jgi:hypothetical protein
MSDCRAHPADAPRIAAVGARGVVRMPQFNGKQGACRRRTRRMANLRCPRNGKRTARLQGRPAPSSQATGVPVKQRPLGRRWKFDLRQPGYRPTRWFRLRAGPLARGKATASTPGPSRRRTPMPTATKAWAPTPSSVFRSTPTTALKPTRCKAGSTPSTTAACTRDYRRISDLQTLGLQWEARWSDRYSTKLALTQGTDSGEEA